MKIEQWKGYNIRFVEKDGEWWAVLKDICDALDLQTYHVKERLKDDIVSTEDIADSIGREQRMLIVNELGVYDTIFQSRKKEAEEFRYWVYDMLKELREASGLEGFQIFKMMDKDFQKQQMARIKRLDNVTKTDYIKANTIANKAVSNKYGFKKMIKKDDMPP